MEEQKIIGRGTWIDKLADELLQREKMLGRSTDLINVESGLGASGIPHIGSLGDAVRAYGVKLALENFGYKAELIAYSDDVDGLRKIPEGLPDWLNEHIAKPVSLIPDPFDCHDSYGLHMSSILLDGLDKLGIKYRFERGIDTYRKGLLKEQIHTILVNSKKIMDSVKVNDLVADEILRFPHPTHVKYEMFLDKGGKKISKSLGNVLTSQAWLRYGTPKSILLLLYKRITGTREIGFEDIPVLMDEYNELENIYFGKIKLDNEMKTIKTKGLYEYVNLLNPPKSPKPYVNYRLLIQLCKIFREDRISRITKKLIEYGTIKESSPEVEELITLAGNYADDFDKQTKVEVKIDDISKKALSELASVLSSEDESTDLQNVIYQIAKNNGVQPKDFFRILYQIILASDRGPKLGPFIHDIGRKKVALTISEYV